MRVPAAVRTVFDQFPLITLDENNEGHADKENTEPVLAVYSLDEDGWPLEPKCLAAAALLHLKSIPVSIEASTPYISSVESLPLLINDTDRTVASTLDQVLSKYYSEEAQDPTFVVYRSLIETWLDDAWHDAVMDPKHDAAKVRAFTNIRDAAQFPWPFSRIKQSQLNNHLEERFVKARTGIYDDYVCSQDNLLRTGMALNALDEVVSMENEVPTPLDIMAFSYTWPIARLLPDSALAALITPKLHAHSQKIRQYLTR